MKPKVFITRNIPFQALEQVKEQCEVEIWEEDDVPVPREVLEEKIRDIDGLFCLLTEKIDSPLLEKAKNLKIVSNMAVGYNNIDVEVATQKGIFVSNTPGILTDTTADLTFALLMATGRRIVESAEFIKNGLWETWSPMLLTGHDIHKATLGIIGLGRIGEAVARRAKGFEMNILYYNRSRKKEAEQEIGLSYTEMDTLLKKSDYVCVMTPYTKETHDLIGERELALMKSTAVLINTSRGGIVNEKALYRALKNEDIWAAGLDVYEEEPITPTHPLLELPNVIALPHIGSASKKTRTRMAIAAAENLIQGVNGKVPNTIINKEVLA